MPSQEAVRQHRAEPPRKFGDLRQYARNTVSDGLEIKPHLGGRGANIQPSAVRPMRPSNALTGTTLNDAPSRFVTMWAGQIHLVQADLTSDPHGAPGRRFKNFVPHPPTHCTKTTRRKVTHMPSQSVARQHPCQTLADWRTAP